MELSSPPKLASLLRAAAAQTIPEKDFWAQFQRIADTVRDPVVGLAHDAAVHYWGNFHERNLFLIRVKPGRLQMMQGQNELNLIADGIEGNWPIDELKRKLDNI